MTQLKLNIFDASEKSGNIIESDNENHISIQRIRGDLPDDIKDNSYLNIFRKSHKDIHNIALYPCKFIPELPRWAIKKYSKDNDIILDPFVGGGTTLIEAKKLNRHSIGIDYNPYSRLISKVKSTILNINELKSCFSKLIQRIINDHSALWLKPDFKGIDFWFNENVQKGLAIIKKHILLIEENDFKNFFLVAFSMTVRKTSYIAPGQILTARRKDWKESKHYSCQETFEVFNNYVREYIKYLKGFSFACQGNSNTVKNYVIDGDARAIVLPKSLKQVDLVVGSPPYINAMDYIWANRLRIHWLDLVKDDKDRLRLYEEEIGTERIKKEIYSEVGITGYPAIDEIIKKIYDSHNSNQQSKLRSRVTYKYFIDMEQHFSSVYEILKPGGRYCIVIGDNNIRKVRVPTTNFLVQIATSLGFVKEKQFNILLKNRSLNIDRKPDFADLIKYDRMIVLKK